MTDDYSLNQLAEPPLADFAALIQTMGHGRFKSQTQIAKYARLYWSKKQSGNNESENTPLAKHGNHYLRYYLAEATNLLRSRDTEYGEFHRKKYAETAKHQHKRAIVLTARKFMRLVDILLRNHQLYLPQRKAIEQ
ncbi:hypothetical protein LTWDN19_16610 [Latilactobacillus curvatus]|uniref:Transposase IS116/IS110/IS902 C-terminal domain-containing protein n=1 Tax=Latilactobacillus curvatus TaxID=28038 RepID=A0ABM7QX30_LATCU|nr:hypothetical protein LTWDN19_16610 [Latilactobacillus curvatus]